MYLRIRKRLNYANVAATLAVLFAMTGGALAASKYIITSTKQIKPSVLAQIKGKNGTPGKDGAPGAQGIQGPAGPAGAQGSKGENGANGANGTNGTNGATGPKGAPGANGATGPTGQTGFTKTLPSGETETGAWSAISDELPEEYDVWTTISFPIPLAASSSEAFFITKKETQEIQNADKSSGQGECAGTLQAPTAPKGKLCVYTEEEILESTTLLGVKESSLNLGYRSAGSYVVFHVGPSGLLKAWGTWAVTAP